MPKIAVHQQKIKHKIAFKLAVICFITFSNSLFSMASEVNQTKLYDMLLAGGALHTCSSMSPKNCRVSDFNSESKNSLLYLFSKQNAQRFSDLVAKIGENNATAMQLNSALVKIYANTNSQPLTRNAFLDLLTEQGLPRGFFTNLSDTLYFALLDTHEVNQTDTNGRRMQEQASVSWTANPASQEIYRTFVDQAKLRVEDNSKPRIAVVTASSRDPFEVADFYLSVFDSLGADVVWLPLDASFQKARYLEDIEAQGCARLEDIRQSFDSFDRERLYPFRTHLQQQYCQQPGLLHDILLNVQGIFFNGGDQSRTLAALTDPLGRPSQELRLIQQQMNSKKLIVGGTSAGTAVQSGGFFNSAPVPMITSGSSGSAMAKGAFPVNAASQRCQTDCADTITADDLTYNANGGLGLFTLGVLDTHFSERDREARLAVLVAESKQRFGFGVDETTALLASVNSDHAALKVIGANGVFMIDSAEGQYTATHTGKQKSTRRQLTGRASYLPSGSTAVFDFDTQEWQFNDLQTQLNTRKKLPQLKYGEWRNQSRQWCNAEKMVKWQHNNYNVALHADKGSRFYVIEKHDVQHCGYTHWPYLIFTQPSEDS